MASAHRHHGLAMVTVLVLLGGDRAAFAAEAKLAWDPPTTNADGTPLADLAGYKVYYGTAPDQYDGTVAKEGPSPIDVPLGALGDPSKPGFTLTGLPACVHFYFAVTAYNKSGAASDFSNKADKLIGCAASDGSPGQGGEGGGGLSSGCSCSTPTGRGRGAWGLALLALLFWRRRRGLLLVVLLSSSTALAGDGSKTYWVDDTGKQTSWPACESKAPLEGAAACTLATANANAAAGETVYLRGGTYSGQTIRPGKSGTESARITFASHTGEKAVIQDSSDGIYIYKQSYITVEGIHFSNLVRFMRIYAGHHNSIGYCKFDRRSATSGEWAGAIIADDPNDNTAAENSTFNRVHHCELSRFIYGGFAENRGALLNLGNDQAAGDDSSFNLVEDNVLYYGGHHTLGVYSKYNVIRNNYFHNETWDYAGYRDMITEGPEAGWCLYEGNRFAYAGAASGLALRSGHNIIRRNELYRNGLGAIQVVHNLTHDLADHNRIYHNVFYHNGFEGSYAGFQGGMFFCNWGNGDPIGNIVKNNIFYDNKNGCVTSDGVKNLAVLMQGVTSNWDKNSEDPGFVKLVGGAPFDPSLPDLHLLPTSPAKDAGTFLTTVSSPSGTGTTLQVADAGYFTDGWGVVPGDRIQLEGQTQTAQVTRVDYAQRTLTLDRALSFTTGKGVSLAYQDSAPDLGAHELGVPSTRPAPPRNLRVE